jgi:hypothetical protein
MCNLYSHTKGPKAIRDLAKAMSADWTDSAGKPRTPTRDLSRRYSAGSALYAQRRARASKDAMGLPVATNEARRAIFELQNKVIHESAFISCDPRSFANDIMFEVGQRV